MSYKEQTNQKEIDMANILLENAGYKDLAYLISIISLKIENFYGDCNGINDLSRYVEKSPYHMAKIFAPNAKSKNLQMVKEAVLELNKVNFDCDYGKCDYVKISDKQIAEVMDIFKICNVTIIDKIINRKKIKQKNEFFKRFEEIYDKSFNNDISDYIREYNLIIKSIIDKKSEMNESKLLLIHRRTIDLFENLLLISGERKDVILNATAIEGGTLKIIALETLMKNMMLNMFFDYDENLISIKSFNFNKELSYYKDDIYKLKMKIDNYSLDELGDIKIINLIKKSALSIKKLNTNLKNKKSLDENEVSIFFNNIINSWGDNFGKCVTEINSLNIDEKEKPILLMKVLDFKYGEEKMSANQMKEQIINKYKEETLRQKLESIKNNSWQQSSSRRKI